MRISKILGRKMAKRDIDIMLIDMKAEIGEETEDECE